MPALRSPVVVEEACSCGGTCAAPAGPPPPGDDLHSFLDELLADQQRLQTPVARFAAAPPAELRAASRSLIPLSAPAPGEQYAFEVDLDRCSGCKACVAGCHSLNGLDEGETWRDVGLLLGGDSHRPFQQTVTTACHHCADPGCLNGCPVLAYEKDPATGIVRHLDDQCIGCQYCVLKCPYDVPKYNARLGIVRKCDLCHGRLAAGEAPACVQACPTEAIRIVKVRTATAPEEPALLPAAPDSKWTRPTTRYLSRRPLPADLVAGDAGTVRARPAHGPLVLMLVLTQAGAGLLLATFAAPAIAPARVLLPVSLALTAAGLAASVAHLGRPLRAWRVFLNLRRSWLSREAVVFGAFFAALSTAVAAEFLPLPDALAPFAATPGAVAAALGVAGVVCSILIYADTPRRFWRWPLSGGRMVGTLLGAALAPIAPVAAAATVLAKLALEASTLLGDDAPARVQRGPLRRLAGVRLALGLAAAAGFVVAPGWPVFALWLAGELAERTLFFRAVDPSRMPGAPA